MSRLPQLKTRHLLFALILMVGVGSFIRLFALGTSVLTLNRDEAALAYNAYLLQQAGVDEWGVRWPLTLQSFGDYKLIGYPALLALFFRWLPLSDAVVRLPAALAGIGLLIVSYFFGKQFGLRPVFAGILVGVIACTPVFIFFSRFAYEANVALLFVVSGLLLWFRSTKHQPQRLLHDLIGVALFTLACFTYNSPFILFPLCVGLVVVTRITLGWKIWLPLFLLSLIAYVLVSWQLLPVLQQKSGISIFTDANVALAFVTYRQNLPQILHPLIGNHYVFWLGIVMSNAIKSLSPAFLAIRIFHPWHGLTGWGQVLWPVAIMGWCGIGWLVVILVSQVKSLAARTTSFQHFTRSTTLQLLGLLSVSLVPALITVDAPHATRSLLFLYIFSVCAVIFLQRVNDHWQKKNQGIWLRSNAPVLTFLILVVLFGSWYVQTLLFVYPHSAKAIFRAGLPEQVNTLSEKKNIAIIDPGGFQYVLLAWYLRVSPNVFLSTIQRQLPDRIGLRYGERLGPYHFIISPNDRSASESALVQWDIDSATWQIKP